MGRGKKKKNRSLSKKQVGLKYGFRSGLEERVANQLSSHEVKYTYEEKKVKYIIPETVHYYTPDFVLENGIIIETKGRFVLEDRKKHLYIRKQHPELDIRFVFTNPLAKIRKGSKTTYADWCEKNGFKYAKGLIPKEWLEEEEKNND